MISYHPDSRFLTDFATGTLSMSEAVCVAAHLHYCGKCRARVQQLTDVGSHIFAALEPAVAGDRDSFEHIMNRIEHDDRRGGAVQLDTPQCASGLRHDANADNLPAVLRKLASDGLSRLNWVQLGKSLRVAPVTVDKSEDRETALYDIRAGGRMPEHEHRGEEITVLLKGSFSDLDGKYSQGDFVVRNAGEAHQPTATQDTDCICLVSLQRPVRPLSWWYRLLEPLVQYRLSRSAN